MKRNILIYILLSSVFFCASIVAQKELKTTDPIEIKVDSILNIMNLDEKIGQMTLFTSDWDQTGPTMRENYQDDIKSGKVGAIFNAHTAQYNRDLQKIAMEETRLKIPLIFGYDVIHGYKTIFPIPLGEAASWDLEAIEKSARISAEEATAAGLHWTFAPMVDITRDPRWGRVCEGAGEDVYLSSEIAKARVIGFQGNDLSAANTMIACAKHYAAYGAAQAGRDYNTVDISERTLKEIYLPPFESSLQAGVRTFMTAFNEIDGIPASASKHLLTDILKQEWGFSGFVVTDYTSINELVPHGYAKDEKHAGELAVNAGADMDMQGAVFYNYLKQSVEEGEVSIETVDDAVRRILRIKFELGLFEDPYKYSDNQREENIMMSVSNLEFSREIARKSMVLLKNDPVSSTARQTLPFSKNLGTIAVIGELSNSREDLIGSWHAAGNGNDCISLLEGINNKLSDKTEVIYARGCNAADDDKSGFQAALEAAEQADAIIVAVGENWWMSGEAASRSEIDLPGVQLELVKKLVEIGKPIVVVLMNGRPLAIPWLADNAPAILETWYSGTQGGHAIADIIFGDYNPSGKLPMTFPRNIGQIPIFYNMKNSGRPLDENDKYTSKYLDIPNTPQFPFGFGLSFTEFKYDMLQTNRSKLNLDESLEVSVRLTNIGEYDGEEVVQLYVHDLVGSTTRPIKELKGFKKVFLKKGESMLIKFILTQDDLAFYTQDMVFEAEPGAFDIFVGGDSNANLVHRVEFEN